MTLLLEMPGSFATARRHAAGTLLQEWLGLEVTFCLSDRRDWCLRDAEGRASLILPDHFFSQAGAAWRDASSIPSLPLPLWEAARDLPEANVLEPALPVIAGEASGTGRWWLPEGEKSYLGLDVFGSAFFLLSGYEEVSSAIRDGHDRFPASASLAQRAGFLERPLLDEYVELLWAAIKRLWPSLQRRRREGQLRFTCDVDHPYEGSSKRFSLLLRGLAGDLCLRRKPRAAAARLARCARAWRGDHSQDPFNTFDWLMERCEAHARQGTFYFIAGHSGGSIDGCYDLQEPYVLSLLARLHRRGHSIGMHGSYNSFRDGAVFRRERAALERACRAAGREQPVVANRQHYLRWDGAVTPALLETSGFTSDSTGSFADGAGFRYGTSHRFPLWDWKAEQPLRIREQPLIVMEWSVIGPRYMNLGRTAAALAKMQELEERCLRFGGDFTLLWHNNQLTTPWDLFALDTLLSRERHEHLQELAVAAT